MATETTTQPNAARPNFTKEEAAVALCTLIAFANREMSAEEAAIMRTYFLPEQADNLERKLTTAGLQLPEGLHSMEASVLETLKAAPRGYQIRTLAVGHELAHSDNTVDDEEFAALERFGGDLAISHGLIREYAERYLTEIDPEHPDNWYDLDDSRLLELTAEEAALGIAALTAFANGEISEEEAVVIRKYFHLEAAQSFEEKLNQAGYTFPDDLAAVRDQITRALTRTPHEWRLRTLAVCTLLAETDNVVDEDEVQTIREFSKEFDVALFEISHYLEKSLKEVVT